MSDDEGSERCMSDFFVAGFQTGEKETSFLRMLCTFVSASIISSWISRLDDGRRLRIFFSHWLSGLVHQVAQLVLSNLILLCWTQREILWVIKVLKFAELVGANMVAITNVAICASLAQVVASHRTLSRVKTAATPGLLLAFWALSVLAAVPAVPFWNSMVVLGTLYWPYCDSTLGNDWVLISSFYVEILAASVMIVIVVLLVVFRRPELRQGVWQVHRRIKYYMGLTLIAIIVDLGLGVGGVMFVLTKHPLYMTVTWAARHVHIVLDTLVLYSALGVTSVPEASGRRRGAGTSSSGGGRGSGKESESNGAGSSSSCDRSKPGGGGDGASVHDSTERPRSDSKPEKVVSEVRGHKRGGSQGGSGGYHVTKPAVEMVDAAEGWGDEVERYSYRRYKSSDMPCASV